MIIVSGILAALLALALLMPAPQWGRRGKAAQALADMWSLETTRKLAEKKTEKPTLDYLLLSAGWQMDVRSFQLLQLGIGLAVTVVVWLFLPGLPALVAGGIAWYTPRMILTDRSKSRGLDIDAHLPLAVVRLATGLLTGGSIKDTLNETASSLDAEGPNPLSGELRLTAVETQTKSVDEALENLAKRSPSESLSNLAFLLQGFSTSGGAKYAESLTLSARNTQQILAARGQARAAAATAFNTVKVVLVGLLVIMLYLSIDPVYGEALRTFGMQCLTGIMFLVMAFGYTVMRKSEREAV